MAPTETSDRQQRRARRPIRSCVACRRRADAREFFRIVRAPGGDLVFDWRRNLGGRGAYVCPASGCIEAAIKRHSFERTLKARVRYPEPGDLIGTARAALTRQLETLIGSAVSSGNLAAGTDAVRRAIAGGDAVCLLVARDAAARERFVGAATAADIEFYVTPSKSGLGALAGRGETGVLSINSHGLAAAIGQAITRLDALGDEQPRNE